MKKHQITVLTIETESEPERTENRFYFEKEERESERQTDRRTD